MVRSYNEGELEDSLRRAFVDKKAKSIILDGHTARSQFLRDSVNYGLEKGLIKNGQNIDEDEVLGKGMGQYFAFTYVLTEEGKKYFGLESKN